MVKEDLFQELDNYKSIINDTLDFITDFSALNSFIETMFCRIKNKSGFREYINNTFNFLFNKTIYIGNNPISLKEEIIVRNYLLLALRTSAKQAETTLKNLENGYDLFILLPLVGLSINLKESFNIMDNVELMDIQALDLSRLKTNLVRRFQGIDGKTISPSSILKVNVGHYSLCENNDSYEKSSIYQSISNDIADSFDLIKDLISILPVATESGCLAFSDYIYKVEGIYYDDSIQIYQDAIGSARHNIYPTTCIIKTSDIKLRTIMQYISLPRNIKDRITDALQYYNKYLFYRGSQYVDAALYLRICLESLLLDGDEGRMAKTCHRAAYLLNDNRKALNLCSDFGYQNSVREFRLLYSICSSFVHSEESYIESELFSMPVQKAYIERISPYINKVFINFIEDIIDDLPQVQEEKYFCD